MLWWLHHYNKIYNWCKTTCRGRDPISGQVCRKHKTGHGLRPNQWEAGLLTRVFLEGLCVDFKNFHCQACPGPYWQTWSTSFNIIFESFNHLSKYSRGMLIISDNVLVKLEVKPRRDALRVAFWGCFENADNVHFYNMLCGVKSNIFIFKLADIWGLSV